MKKFNNDYRIITLSQRKYHYGPRWHTKILLTLLTIWNALLSPVQNYATINHARMIVLAWSVGVLLTRSVPFLLETLAAGYIEKVIGV